VPLRGRSGPGDVTTGGEAGEWLSLSGRAAGAGSSVVELVGQGMVEHEHGDRFGVDGKRLSSA